MNLSMCKYQYVDHRRIRAWGDNLKEAFEQSGIALLGYLTELTMVEIKQCLQIVATGDNLETLLFHFLDELLLLFFYEPFLVFSKLEITEFITEGQMLSLRCNCYGEQYQIGKHSPRREVEGINYWEIEVVNEPEMNVFEVYFSID